MKVIPVIDLMGGVAVHAQRGHREHYRPLSTPLCGESRPLAVLEAFLRLSDFDEFYLADLDALTRRGDQMPLIEAICRSYPRKRFWVDRGIAGLSAENDVPANLVPVIGSESLATDHLPLLHRLPSSWILSLDSRPSQTLGPKALFETAEYWPDKVIIMTLGRVGSAQGPDFDRLAKYCKNWPHTRFVAAGGIRDGEDLERLHRLGIHGALVASALHFGTVNAESLRRRSG